MRVAAARRVVIPHALRLACGGMDAIGSEHVVLSRASVYSINSASASGMWRVLPLAIWIGLPGQM
jgi:hypothetical protein